MGAACKEAPKCMGHEKTKACLNNLSELLEHGHSFRINTERPPVLSQPVTFHHQIAQTDMHFTTHTEGVPSKGLDGGKVSQEKNRDKLSSAPCLYPKG
jgi:hypothetical protein